MSSKPLIPSPHDRVFRASMGNINVAREYFAKNLPKEILAVTDLTTLQLCPQTYVDEELKLSQSDVLYQVNIAEQPAYLYLLAEHQSTPDRLMPYRVIKYEVAIWADHLKQYGGQTLPLIVTTVFYNGRQPYCYSTDFRDLLNAPRELIDAVWRQPFKLIDAHDITDEDLRQHKWFGVLAFFMAHIFAREFLPYLGQVMPTLKELEGKNGSDYVVALLNYALTTAETGNTEGFVDIVKQGLSAKTGEEVMTIAQQFMERGKKQGLEQGLQQGLEQGELNGKRTLLKKLLAKRFGSVSAPYLDQLDNASEARLSELSDNLMEAEDIKSVFATRH